MIIEIELPCNKQRRS